MRFLTKAINSLSLLSALVLFFVWYSQKHEIEPLIGIFSTGATVILEIITKFTTRPKIILHKQKTYWSRNPKGYTINNPTIIHLGIDKPDQLWELSWNHNLHIRNNSSHTAYNLNIKYLNLPDKTKIEGEIGKMEPVLPNDLRVFKIRLVQNVTGTNTDADRYMEENADILTTNLVIEIKYNDESGLKFKTRYTWVTDKNQLLIF